MTLATGNKILTFIRQLGGKLNSAYYLLVDEYNIKYSQRPNKIKIIEVNESIVVKAVYDDGAMLYGILN